MKIILLVAVLLVGSALAQNSAAPTKQPKPTKPPKTGPVITCSNITRYRPSTCCPSYPSLQGKEIATCDRQCRKPNSTDVCCISNCTMRLFKGINPDGSFNASAITVFFVKYSHSKNKTIYTSFVAGVVQKCLAVPPSGSSCQASDVAFCIYRELFFQCPDYKNNTLCKSMYDAAKQCPGYPFIGDSEKPKSSKNEVKQNSTKTDNTKKDSAKKDGAKKDSAKKESDKKENDKKKKNQEVNGKNSTTANPSAANGTKTASVNNTSAQSNKAQKAKAINFPETTQKPSTTVSGKNTTHKSESKDGALGKDGPGFRP